MNEKLLVTGGAGYIGSHVVRQLGEAGYDVVVYDNLSTGRKEAVLAGRLVVGDLSDTEKLAQLFSTEKFDGVLHFAGSIVVPESVELPIEYYYNNTSNSLNLISLCKKYEVKKFIFSSTAATYGIVEGGVAYEDSPQIPINPYGSSKLMTEWMLRDYSDSSDFRFVALRYFNVAGADFKQRIGQSFSGATHLIKVSCEAACGKRKGIKLFGTDYDTEDGTCVRDYIHVEDLARAHLDAYAYLANSGKSQFLNCGYGHGFSVKDVISMVKKVSGVDFSVEETERRQGDSPILISNADKIGHVLKWTPKYNDLELIIKSAYDWESV